MKKLAIIAIIFLSIEQVQAQDLLETYQLALENNPDLKQAYFEKMAVSEVRSQSIAQMLPTLTATALTARERLNSRKATYQGSGVQNYYKHTLEIDLIQPVFHWEHWVQLAQSENKIAQAQAQYLAEEQALMLKVTEAYFNTLAVTADLDFTLAEKRAVAQQYQKTKDLFAQGWVVATEVDEAQAALDKIKASQIKAENELNDAFAKLSELTGSQDNVVISHLVKEFKPIPPVPTKLSDWIFAAKSNNFSIIAALNQLEIKRKDIEIQQSGHYPQLDIVGSYGISDENNRFGLRGDGQSIGLKVTVPLFAGGLVTSKTRQAIYEFQAAQEALHKTENEVIRQVKNNYRSVFSSLAQIAALKTTVNSADKLMNAVEAKFAAGTRTTIVDVLNAQKKHYEAQRDYSHAIYDYLLNGIRLKQISSSLTQEDLSKINQLLEH